MRGTTMRSATYRLSAKAIVATAGVLMAVLFGTLSAMSPIAAASSIIGISSNISQVPAGETFQLTVKVQDDGDVHELEVDHSLDTVFPEFSVYADSSDPYGAGDATQQPQFAAAGVTVTYDELKSEWLIDFGTTITDYVKNSPEGAMTFYLALKDASSQVLWGTMSPPTAENTFSFNFVDGTGAELVPDVVDTPTPEVVIPKTPNTGLFQ